MTCMHATQWKGTSKKKKIKIKKPALTIWSWKSIGLDPAGYQISKQTDWCMYLLASLTNHQYILLFTCFGTMIVSKLFLCYLAVQNNKEKEYRGSN